METKRKGTLTEYRPVSKKKAEGKKVKDVSYLFSDEYDESKTPVHYTKKHSAWTSTLRRSSMRAATAKTITALPFMSKTSNEREVFDDLPKKTKTTRSKPTQKTVAKPVAAKPANVKLSSVKVKAVKPTASKSTVKKSQSGKPAATKITAVQEALTVKQPSSLETATKLTSAQGTASKQPLSQGRAVKLASADGVAAKPSSEQNKIIRKKKPAGSTDQTKVIQRSTIQKEIVGDGSETRQNKPATSARPATEIITATRTAATTALDTQDTKEQTKIIDRKTVLGLSQARKPANTRRKKVWPYMVMIALVVFIASLVTFLYLIRSSQDLFFLSIRDKDAPILRVTDLNIYNDETVTVDDFVIECDDLSRVNVYLKSPIDYSITGEQKVTIVAEDEAGHKTVRSAKLMHIIDKTGPLISGDPLIRTVKGESIAYKSHISVIDDFDPDPVITVNNSEVNLEEEGSYPVWYTATDKWGNQTTFQSEVVVSKPSDETVSDEEVNALVDSILSQIITDDMQPIDKVWAVYEYVRHIQYAKGEYSYNYKYEGYKYLRDQKGDCYGSYAASKLFFDRLGFPNLSLEKKGGSTHFWNMVSIDGGKTFYHFDATYWHEWAKKPVMCMISDAVLEEISTEHKGTHQYDHSQFPATPADSLPMPDYVPSKYGEDY